MCACASACACAWPLFTSSVRALAREARPAAREGVDPCPIESQTTFVHVGSHDDVFALHTLQPCERAILLVEPLTLHLNSKRANAYKHLHARLGDFQKAAIQQEFDNFFECHRPGMTPDAVGRCVRQPGPHDVYEFARILFNRVAAAASLGCALADGAYFGLRDFRFLRSYPVCSLRSSPPRIELEFMAAGHARHLTMLVAPISAIDWSSALVGPDGVFRPVSTLVHAGVIPQNSQPAADYVCDHVGRDASSMGNGTSAASKRPRGARWLRFLRTPPTEPLHCRSRTRITQQLVRHTPCKAPCVAANSASPSAVCTCELFNGCRQGTLTEIWL
jgi:hypothetical protein